MFFSFKEVETIKGVKLSLALLCGFIFLFACMPTALGCEMDIKPGSYPNSINVNNKGVVTIAIEGSEAAHLSQNAILYLHQGESGPVISCIGINSFKYEYVDDLEIDRYLTGNPYRTSGYIFKINTEDISKLAEGHLDEGDLYLALECGDLYGKDSVRLLSNNK